MDDLNKLIQIIKDTITEMECNACQSLNDDDELWHASKCLKNKLNIFNIERGKS